MIWYLPVTILTLEYFTLYVWKWNCFYGHDKRKDNKILYTNSINTIKLYTIRFENQALDFQIKNKVTGSVMNQNSKR